MAIPTIHWVVDAKTDGCAQHLAPGAKADTLRRLVPTPPNIAYRPPMRSAMTTRLCVRPTFVFASFVLGGALGCDLVRPSNEFDPAAPLEKQARARIRGAIVLLEDGADDATLQRELAEVVVTVIDDTGRPRENYSGEPLVLPLEGEGSRATFTVDLAPGAVRLAVTQIPSRFNLGPSLPLMTLLAGSVVDLGDLVWTSPGGGPGSIEGTVGLEGGSGGARAVQVYRLTADGQQQLFASRTTDTQGHFSVPNLPVGTYAVAADLPGFSPDYRLDVAVGEAQGQALAHTFDGDDALILHPITAVVLPQGPLQGDGMLSTRQDEVPAAILAFGGVTGMRLQAAACTLSAPDCADVTFADDQPFVPYSASATLSLPDVEGRIGLFAQFEARSAGGFVFHSPVFAAVVLRDTTPPLVREARVLGGAPSAEIVVTESLVNLSIQASDDGGIASVGSVLGSQAPDPALVPLDDVTAPPGTAFFERTVGLPEADGRYTAWFVVADRAGNRSAPLPVSLLKDAAPPAAVPLFIDAVMPDEGRAVRLVVGFASSQAEEIPVWVQVAARTLPADPQSGRTPFSIEESYVVDTTGVDGETLLVKARFFDEVGNFSEVEATTVLSLRGALSGVVNRERMGTSRDAAGTVVQALGVDGRLLGSTATTAAGTWSLPSLPEGRVSLTFAAPGYRSSSLDAGFVEAESALSLDSFLSLQRGTLTGQFRLADKDASDEAHGGILVEARMQGGLREATPRPALTSANGTWSMDQLPATLLGESYTIVASAEGYSSVAVQEVVVDDNGVVVVHPRDDDESVAEPLLLLPVSGDFIVCAPTPAFGPCAPLVYTNLARVRVRLRDDNDVTQIRAFVAAPPPENILPFVPYDDDADVVVELPAEQGTMAVYVEVDGPRGRATLGPVEVTRDTIAPSPPTVTLARGSRARKDGFTRERIVVATVTTDPADGDERERESPLVSSPTFFAASVPAAPQVQGTVFCPSGGACGVPLPAVGGVVREGRHDVYAFACDAAGNCSAQAGTAAIVFDETPPSMLHGVSFGPDPDDAVSLGLGRYRTRTGAFSLGVEVGEAQTALGEPVLDLQGVPVRDVEAAAFSFVAAIDAAAAADLMDGTEPGTTARPPSPALLGGEGEYQIFARFIDAAGNQTLVEPNPFGFTITLDQTSPSGRLVLNDGASLANRRDVAARIDALSEDRVLVKLVADAGECSSDDGFVDAGALPTTTLLTEEDGAQLVLACLKDDVGNVGFATDTVTLDRIAPTGAVVLGGGSDFTDERTLVASFAALSPDIASMNAVLHLQGSPSLDCAQDQGYVALANSVVFALAHDAVNGQYAVEVCFEDGAGNRTAQPVSDTILFDTTAPSIALQLNRGDDFTTSSQVVASITASDDLDLNFSFMRFSSTTTFTGPSEAFANDRAGLELSAPTVEGVKTVCVEVEDELGRKTSACDDIVLDLTPPVGFLSVPPFATSSPVVVTIRSDDLNIEGAAVGEGLDCATASYTTLARATPTAREVSLVEGASEGTRSIVACLKDEAGQVARLERTFVFDPTDPPVAQAVAPAANAFLRARRPTFFWTPVVGAVRYRLVVRNIATQQTVLDKEALPTAQYTPSPAAPDESLVDGTYEWLVAPQKASGRTAAVSFADAPRFTVDGNSPTAATAITIAAEVGRSQITSGSALHPSSVTCTASLPCLNDPTPTLSFSPGSDAVDDALVHQVEIARAVDVSFSAPVASIARSDGSSFDLGTPLGNERYLLRVRSIDDAGNVATSAISTFVIDTTPPDAPSFLPTKSPVSTAVTTNVGVSWTSEVDSGATTYTVQMIVQGNGFRSSCGSDTGCLSTDLAGSGPTPPATTVNIGPSMRTGSGVVHQVRLVAADALGNRSTPSFIAVTNDTAPPCTTDRRVTVLGSDVNNQFSNTNAVVLDVACLNSSTDPLDGPAKMAVGCDGNPVGKPFVAFSNVATCVLAPGDGTKTVGVVIVDEAGNPTTAVIDTITMDRRAPTTPVLSIDAAVTNDPLYSFVIEDPSTDANFLRHEFIDGVGVTSFDDPRAVVTGTTVSLLLTEERTHTIRVRGIDRAGNASPEAIASVTFDITPPTSPVIAGSESTVFVNTLSYTFALTTPSQDTNFDHYELSTNNASFARLPGDGLFTAPLTPNTTHLFRLRGVDKAGNAGPSGSLTVVQDSRNPRPLTLHELPAFSSGGAPRAFSTSTFTSRGSYVDVHLARSETDLSPTSFDPHLDHFEVRATHPTFANFVPLCATPSPRCPSTSVVADNGTSVFGPDHLILVGSQIAGFRIPLVVGRENTITVRAIDKAGNASAETSVSTTEGSVTVATNDRDVELESSLFGDRLAYLVPTSPGFAVLKVRTPGNDARFGTADDSVASLGNGGAFAPNSLFSSTAQAVAQAPGVIAAALGGDVQAFAPTPVYESTANSRRVLDQDPTKTADQPSAWGQRVAFRQAGAGGDTDLFVREAGPDGIFDSDDDQGTDDTLATADDPFVGIVADDAQVQFFPQISGDHMTWFRCATVACNGAGEPRLFVAHVGADGHFGKWRTDAAADDVVVELTQAVGIDPTKRPRLYAPATPGRPACRTVVAYARSGAGTKGVYVIAAGADRVFDVTDPPVQVMSSESLGTGSIFGFDLYDDVVVASDGFAPPFSEIVTGGPDGCLTRTADNIAFDSGVTSYGYHLAVHDQRVVLSRFSPTSDIVILELGAERVLWPRDEGTSFVGSLEADDDVIAFGGGGIFDLTAHRLDRPFINAVHETDTSAGNLAHAAGAEYLPGPLPQFQALELIQRGDDEVWGVTGTGVLDDRTVNVGATRPLAHDSNYARSRSATFAVDVDTVVWGGRQLGGTLVVPVLRTAGLDRLFGTADDCEREMSSSAANGYAFLRSSWRRQAFMKCSDVGCGSVVGELQVRETTGDVCSGSATVTTLVPLGFAPDLDGPRLVYLENGVVRVTTGGADGKLSTVIDNVTFRLSSVTTSSTEAPRVSGDRVVWIDSRYETPRVMLGDMADGSERVLARSDREATSVSIEGDIVTWSTSIPGEALKTDHAMAFLGIQPDLPHEHRAAGATRLRCPSDDDFEENDSAATHTALPSGSALTAVVCRNDEDHFAITVPRSGCVVRASAVFVHADGDLSLTLLNGAGQVLRSSAGTTNQESVTHTATATDTYDLQVTGVLGAENTYDIGVTVTCP